ncbi:prolipoprotein diacylglyceryl transferase [Candidatus Nitrosoglobus terrae]|uniref:Phosphatidylglycerol--prolipoprotein diacylglyceryl transferase n=1 Tax=Candidatus Nitrosoglobus terrae TaxID=1630141 RepID=A0A1Q2SPW5_9GAMM|nr:prolipoprotein diacylglyceryl transferase [Candidatus Nitrosoglobus terrae]BAW81153.1 prolipoprotein diacylglyceryl transferase [Candidatus Nitrosoglobus terrae]
MINYPNIDPVALSLGPIKIHWYGVMYLIGFIGGWWLGRIRAQRPLSGWKPEQIDDLLFYCALGVVLGGRLGYVFFYGFDYLITNPGSIFKVWQGGMSFHGGLLGVLIAMGIYARKTGRSFFQVTDFIAPLIPVGLGAGRMGNFINGELWGKATDLPWGMIFHDPRAGDIPRHPSQLYEFALEGVVFFLILWFFSNRNRPPMAVSGLFLICYGLFRFAIEFVRVPDPQLGYLTLGWVTMGQILSLPMIIAGIGFLGWAYWKR